MLNIKKSLTNAKAISEILQDLLQDPEDEELLFDLDFYLSALTRSIYERGN